MRSPAVDLGVDENETAAPAASFLGLSS